MIKCNLSFAFKVLRMEAIMSFFAVLYFSIQVNNKLDVGVQRVTKIIVYDVKCAFEKFRMQSVIRVIKCNLSFVFKVLRIEAIMSFYAVLYFSIQVNNKLNVGMQRVTKIIVYGAKCAFKKFRMRSVIKCII